MGLSKNLKQRMKNLLYQHLIEDTLRKISSYVGMIDVESYQFNTYTDININTLYFYFLLRFS